MSHKKGKDAWGPPTWKSYHYFSAGIRPEKAADYKLYEICIGRLVPCDECSQHFLEMIKQYPPDPYLTNPRNCLFRSYMLHHFANEQINFHHPEQPKKVSPPYDEFEAEIFSALKDECRECNTF